MAKRITSCRGKNNPNAKTWRMKDPKGVWHEINDGLYSFCRKHGLSPSTVEKSYRYGAKMQNGWYISSKKKANNFIGWKHRLKARLTNGPKTRFKKIKEEMKSLHSKGLLAENFNGRCKYIEDLISEAKISMEKSLLGERHKFSERNKKNNF